MTYVNIQMINSRTLLVKYKNVHLFDQNGYLSDYVELINAYGERSVVYFAYSALQNQNCFAFSIVKFSADCYPSADQVNVVVGKSGSRRQLDLRAEDNLLYNDKLTDVYQFHYKDNAILFRINFDCDLDMKMLPQRLKSMKMSIAIDRTESVSDSVFYAFLELNQNQIKNDLIYACDWFGSNFGGGLNYYRVEIERVSSFITFSLKCDKEDFLKRCDILIAICDENFVNELTELTPLLSSNSCLQFSINLNKFARQLTLNHQVKFLIALDKRAFLSSEPSTVLCTKL